jgi:hypothetical protein
LAANPSDRASPKVRDAIGKDTSHNQGGGGLPVLLYVLMQRHCVSSFELGDGGGVAGVLDGEGIAGRGEERVEGDSIIICGLPCRLSQCEPLRIGKIRRTQKHGLVVILIQEPQDFFQLCLNVWQYEDRSIVHNRSVELYPEN